MGPWFCLTLETGQTTAQAKFFVGFQSVVKHGEGLGPTISVSYFRRLSASPPQNWTPAQIANLRSCW